MKNVQAVWLVFLLCFSCESWAGGAPRELALESVVLETLNAGAITFLAKSTGCTQKEDFQLQLQGFDLSIIRKKPDRCRRMPFWVRFELPLSFGAAVKSVNLLNPLVLQ